MSLFQKNCVPCEGGVAPLSNAAEERLHTEIPEWILDRKGIHQVRRSFKCDTYMAALALVNAIAPLAEKENHHPDITLSYNRVTVVLYTHSILGLSENDFILAAKIDALVTVNAGEGVR